jgi:hypothetical protein
MTTTVTESVYVFDALNQFYVNHMVATVNGSIQVFHSLTFGEMIISILLATIIILFSLKWVYEVLR